MRRVLWLCLPIILLTGCSRTPLPPTAVRRRPPVVAQNVPPTVSELPAQPDPKAQAARLAEKLADDDEGVRVAAAQGLCRLGEPGFPYLVKGTQSPTVEVRRLCLELLNPPMLQAHPDETISRLLKLLDDPDREVRREAARRLAWYTRAVSAEEAHPGPLANQRLDALKIVSIRDKSPEVRTVAQESMALIKQAVVGKRSDNIGIAGRPGGPADKNLAPPPRTLPGR